MIDDGLLLFSDFVYFISILRIKNWENLCNKHYSVEVAFGV